MDSMLDCVEIIRRKYEYEAYIHLKVMPGAEVAQIERAARLADRLSINLEGANEHRLQQLAPKKDFWQELLPPLYWLKNNRHTFEPWTRIPSLTTQFVVGPAGESDQELLLRSDQLYRQAGLSRAYYSAFNPIPGTRFETMPKTEPLRQHRLYQADWLLRFYGFSIGELPFDNNGNLPVATDPKLKWAEYHLLHRPLEINRATRSELLRVPGIGPKGANSLLAARRQQKICEAAQLKKLGINPTRAAPFVLLNGQRLDYQLSLPGL
jgi:predicted DNA-binding helix-hairpin-helix protein